MARQYSETVRCVCDNVVRRDDVVFVSRHLDKWDLRSRAELAYCRGCKEGERECKEWLFKDFTPEEEDES
jgi:hypothetical protein